MERAVFLAVLHRLVSPGSDRSAAQWRRDYAIGGAQHLELHHLYRAMGWLGAPLPEDEQDGATPALGLRNPLMHNRIRNSAVEDEFQITNPRKRDALRRNRVMLTDFAAQEQAAFLVIGVQKV